MAVLYAVWMADETTWLWSEPERLTARHDSALLDLDGVVYLLGEPIRQAPEAIESLRAAGVPPVFVTNNASRSATEVAALLSERGVPAEPDEVRTSAQTVAVLLRERLPSGSNVMVVGTSALAAEISSVGLRPVWPAESTAVAAVVQGFGPGIGWEQLAEAAVAVREGALWAATNPDRTMPSPRGELPGNGSLVSVVAAAVGRSPDLVAGKPGPLMFRQAAEQAGARRPLVVGDRWDTDIAGGNAAGYPGLMVLSGSMSPWDVLATPPHARPRYLAWDLGGVNDPHPVVGRDGDGSVRCEGWRVSETAGVVRLAGAGDPLDALRALAEFTWGRTPAPPENAVGGGVAPRKHDGDLTPQIPVPEAAGDTAAQALDVLGLSNQPELHQLLELQHVQQAGLELDLAAGVRLPEFQAPVDQGDEFVAAGDETDLGVGVVSLGDAAEFAAAEPAVEGDLKVGDVAGQPPVEVGLVLDLLIVGGDVLGQPLQGLLAVFGCRHLNLHSSLGNTNAPHRTASVSDAFRLCDAENVHRWTAWCSQVESVVRVGSAVRFRSWEGSVAENPSEGGRRCRTRGALISSWCSV
ncbi:hypothetical protein GCM10023223_00030 [Stackebrandtia albiflava]